MASDSHKHIEKRKYVRLPKKYLMHCTNVFPTDDEAFKIAGEVKNISGGGVIFSSRKNYAAGEVLELELDIPGWQKYSQDADVSTDDSKNKPLVARGVVTRTAKAGTDLYDIAVELLDMDRKDRWALMFAILNK